MLFCWFAMEGIQQQQPQQPQQPPPPPPQQHGGTIQSEEGFGMLRIDASSLEKTCKFGE